MTTTSSCTMMLAVMYGMIPSAKTDSRSSAPPENRLTSEYTSRWSEAWAASRQLLMASTDTPGPGMAAPNRYTAMIARENSSLRRRSGVRNAAANACSTCPPLVGRMRLATGAAASAAHPGERGFAPPGPAAAEPGQQKAPLQGPAAGPVPDPTLSSRRVGRTGSLIGGGQGGPPSDGGRAAPGRGDLLGGGRREGVRAHLHRD